MEHSGWEQSKRARQKYQPLKGNKKREENVIQEVPFQNWSSVEYSQQYCNPRKVKSTKASYYPKFELTTSTDDTERSPIPYDTGQNEPDCIDEVVECEEWMFEKSVADVADIKSESCDLDVSTSAQQRFVFCKHCRTEQDQSHTFCPNCGTRISDVWFNSSKKYDTTNMLLEAEEMMINDQCEKHKRKTIEYYCKTCDELACTVCMFRQHRGCENIVYIDEIAENVEDTEEYKQLTDDLETLSQKCGTNGQYIEQRQKDITDAKDKALKKIHALILEAKCNLDKLENKMMDEVKSRNRADQELLDNLQKEHASLSKQLDLIKRKSDSSKATKEVKQIFLFMKTEKKVLNELETKAAKLTTENNLKTYIFKASQSVEQLQNLDSMGELQDRVRLADWRRYEIGSDWAS